jgi:predicted esterase
VPSVAGDPFATTSAIAAHAATQESPVKTHRIPRVARKVALVCLALVATLGVVLALTARAAARVMPVRMHVTDPRAHATKDDTVRAKYPTTPLALHQDGRTILAFPPRASTPTTSSSLPLTVVYLHGIHGRAENGCPWLREGASELGWLVCPDANEHLANDTFSWAGSVADQHAIVARAERAAQAQGADATSAGVLVGFSQGAYVALDLVRAQLGRYRGVVLIGADVTPSRAVLAAAGVERIVLAAGDLDGASGPMKRAAEHLGHDGMEVRFVSLGRIGHSYQTTEKEALRDAIVWAGGSS